MSSQGIGDLYETSLLEDLQQATSQLYDEFSEDVMSDASIITREAYITHLRRFHDAARLCMQRIDWDRLSALGLGHCDERRARYKLMRQDLESLGVEGPEQTLDDSSEKVAGLSDELVIGTVYVLEGSIHVGRDIAAAFIKGRVGIKAKNTRFLSGFGIRTHARWQELMLWLDGQRWEQKRREVACSAAKDAFAILAKSLTP